MERRRSRVSGLCINLNQNERARLCIRSNSLHTAKTQTKSHSSAHIHPLQLQTRAACITRRHFISAVCQVSHHFMCYLNKLLTLCIQIWCITFCAIDTNDTSNYVACCNFSLLKQTIKLFSLIKISLKQNKK